MSTQPATQRASRLFERCYGRDAEAVASAPGRVNLIGEHTDYNDGFVLPMAIEPRTAVAIAPSDDGQWIFSTENDAMLAVRSTDAEAMDRNRRDWTSYVRGVVAGFRRIGHDVPSLRVAVASDVPTGGGLSSSASLEVATATALERLLGVRLDAIEKALLCQQAEHEFAGVPCGFMDQAISVMATPEHALLIDCRSRATRPIRIDRDQVAVLIMNSMVRHELSNGAYAERRRQCEAAVAALQAAGLAVEALRDVSLDMLEKVESRVDKVVLQRARHVVTEIARTVEAAAALERADYIEFGRQMNRSHASLRDDYEVSCEELDVFVELAWEQDGVFGARMTGGGFGGCIVALVRPEQATAIGEAVARGYQRRFDITPHWFTTGAGPGALAEL